MIDWQTAISDLLYFVDDTGLVEGTATIHLDRLKDWFFGLEHFQSLSLFFANTIRVINTSMQIIDKHGIK